MPSLVILMHLNHVAPSSMHVIKPSKVKAATANNAGFTLIELSIVLMIIGLIVGGILVGQDLINAARIRAQLSQLGNFNAAVNTFQTKYNALPGDMNSVTANACGFAPRGQYAGEGDGNGIIEGVAHDAAGNNCGTCEQTGETAMFWSDLTYANGQNLNLISGNFTQASATYNSGNNTSGAAIGNYFPTAAIGRGNYIYVWSGGNGAVCGGNDNNSINYFGLSATTTLGWGSSGSSNTTMSVVEAYEIDSKIDDGNPLAGKVTAMAMLSSQYGGAQWVGDRCNRATPASSTTCYDNNNINYGPAQYSISQKNGSGLNCALSFQF